MNEHSGEGQSAGARDGLGVGHTSAFCLITCNFTMPLCNRIWRNKSFCDNGNNPSPTTFWAGHALLLPGGTFLRPRNGRAETAICPGEGPLPCPQPRSVRVQSASAGMPTAFPCRIRVHNLSVDSLRPRSRHFPCDFPATGCDTSRVNP
jgi:hypothetical protein